MKRTLLALPALMAAAGLAHADSNVSIYGIMDAGVEYVTNSNAAKDHLFREVSGAMNTSRLGFRGTEDLGNGLKGVFQLEGGIKLNNGTSDGDLFGRQANVGLEGGFGRLVAGRSFSTTYDFVLPFDPMGYSANYSWVTSGNATGARKDGMITGTSNMLKYSVETNGFKFGATYGFGNVAGNSSDSARFALGVGYANGPFAVTANWDQANGTVNTAGAYDKATTFHLAGSYVVGSAKLYLGYRDYKQTLASGAADKKSAMYWGGASYQVTPTSTIIGTLYYQDLKNLPDGTDADPRMISLRYKYALSKRTDLYTSVARATAKNGKLVSVSRDDAGFDSSQTGITLGIQHRF
jgi:predicted porin